MLDAGCQRSSSNDPISRLEGPSLGRHGRRDLLADAFQDGSSVVCVRCGDLVARARWAAHRDAWCRMLPDDDDDDDDDDAS